MKRHLAAILTVTALSFLLCSCGMFNGPNGTSEDESLVMPPANLAQTSVSSPVSMAEITEMNVKEVLLSIPEPENYTWNATVTYSTGSRERVKEITVYRSGGLMRCDTQENGRTESTVYIDGENVYVVDPSARRYNAFKTKADGALLSLAEFSDEVSLSDAVISSASEQVTDGESVIVASVSDAELMMEEEYVISVRTGMPMKVTSTVGSSVYTLVTGLIDTDSPVDGSVFELPGYVSEVKD